MLEIETEFCQARAGIYISCSVCVSYILPRQANISSRFSFPQVLGCVVQFMKEMQIVKCRPAPSLRARVCVTS